MVLFFLFGLLFASAKSTSHEPVTHTQHTDASHHAQVGEHEDDSVAVHLDDAEHSHEHDPGDHTHDIPLRRTLAAVKSSFAPGWETQSSMSLYSISIFRLERPPKLTILA